MFIILSTAGTFWTGDNFSPLFRCAKQYKFMWAAELDADALRDYGRPCHVDDIAAYAGFADAVEQGVRFAEQLIVNDEGTVRQYEAGYARGRQQRYRDLAFEQGEDRLAGAQQGKEMIEIGNRKNSG